eukprot:1363560-Amorphochlora_amoeboformis.AAC.1
MRGSTEPESLGTYEAIRDWIPKIPGFERGFLSDHDSSGIPPGFRPGRLVSSLRNRLHSW